MVSKGVGWSAELVIDTVWRVPSTSTRARGTKFVSGLSYPSLDDRCVQAAGMDFGNMFLIYSKLLSVLLLTFFLPTLRSLSPTDYNPVPAY